MTDLPFFSITFPLRPSPYLAPASIHGLCAVPAIHIPLYIVVVYCLYFLRLCQLGNLPHFTRTPLIVISTPSRVDPEDSACSPLYHPWLIVTGVYTDLLLLGQRNSVWVIYGGRGGVGNVWGRRGLIKGEGCRKGGVVGGDGSIVSEAELF